MFESIWGIAFLTSTVILLISIVVVIILLCKSKKDKHKYEELNEKRYQDGRKEVTEVMRQTIDQIQDDRRKLSQLPEKDILIEVMIALGGYARRIDRIEEKIQCLSHYTDYVDKMMAQANEFTKIAQESQVLIKNAENSVSSMNELIQKANTGVGILNGSLADVSLIKQTTEKLSSDIKESISDLEVMDGQLRSVVDKFNMTFSTFGNGPMGILNDIEESLSEISSDVSDVSQTVSRIDNQTDNYSTWDLYSKLSNIERLLDSIDNQTDSYSTWDLYSKLSNIERLLDSIKDKINSLDISQ